MRILLFTFLLILASGAVASETAGPSPAESGNPLPATDDQWRFTIAFPMIWAPDIDGKIRGDESIDFSTEFRALYRVSDLNNFWFGYRYLQIGNDTKQDDLKYKVDMIQHGPTLGWAFTFK